MKILPEEQYKYVKLLLPDGSKAEGHEVLLHACCAPCSSAIVECMLRNGMKPTVFFSNSNIYPLEEYETRKQSSVFLPNREFRTLKTNTTMTNGEKPSQDLKMNQNAVQDAPYAFYFA